jgi:hypothetical protein
MRPIANSPWGDLNPRQQAYLRAIYETDQEAEQNERARWGRGLRSRPADVWRWLPYELGPTGDTSPLKRRLRKLEMIDPGTGSTFDALEKRGLILCRYKRGYDEATLDVRMTPQGRRLVRQAAGLKVERRPRGELCEWHWRALVVAYKAGAAGLDDDWGYGRIGWRTWLRLRDYGGDPFKGLVEEADCSAPQPGRYVPPVYRLYITRFGIEFYESHYAHYHGQYPDVDAPAPTERKM